MAPLLELRDLRKQFGSTRALDGVSFSVAPGEIFGLLGPNGAGKSTLLSIISGLLDPDAGSLLLDGKPFSGHDRPLRRLIGLVPQELAIYQELTARENLRFLGELYRINGQTLTDRIDRILHAVGLEAHADQRTGTFSGGMKRRLNLGAALVHAPRLLLLDEPTAGVDPQSRNHIFEEVRRMHREGTTILYTTHYMEEVQALCEGVGILDHGKLIACDQVDGLLRLLPGRIHFRLTGSHPEFLDELRNWPGATLCSNGAKHILQTPDVSKALLPFADWARRNHLDITDLRIEEPNLERVFLHLTGRQLRD